MEAFDVDITPTTQHTIGTRSLNFSSSICCIEYSFCPVVDVPWNVVPVHLNSFLFILLGLRTVS